MKNIWLALIYKLSEILLLQTYNISFIEVWQELYMWEHKPDLDKQMQRHIPCISIQKLNASLGGKSDNK